LSGAVDGALLRGRGMVVVAQLVEHRVVVPGVAGSSPVDHPILVGNTETGPVGRPGLWRNQRRPTGSRHVADSVIARRAEWLTRLLNAGAAPNGSSPTPSPCSASSRICACRVR
jgi:hypothetical protein